MASLEDLSANIQFAMDSSLTKNTNVTANPWSANNLKIEERTGANYSQVVQVSAEQYLVSLFLDVLIPAVDDESYIEVSHSDPQIPLGCILGETMLLCSKACRILISKATRVAGSVAAVSTRPASNLPIHALHFRAIPPECRLARSVCPFPSL